jgi:organic radical activating enzyme
MITGSLAEVFSATQGEGLFVGQRQLFVRLAGCNLRCRYCDTAWARERTPCCRAEHTPGGRDFTAHANPLDVEDAAALGLRLHVGRLHDAVSFTGGEPLLQPEFLRDLARRLRAAGLPAHLETNGTLAEALARVSDAVDVIAMDLKLPSAAGFACWDEHRAFLDAARPFMQRPGALLFAKAVFAQATTEQEIERACTLLARVSAEIPLVLQPVSAVAGGPEPPAPARALALQAAAKPLLADVRVIPQTHKLMGQM